METGYLRAGCGPAVLLLVPASQTVGSSGNGPGTFDGLVDALAAHCRVFVPDADPALPFSEWLRGFMDGLGLVSASLVADDAVGAHALDFARTHPERVDRVAILRSDGDGDGEPIDADHAVARFLASVTTG
jgi:4,5:9,10-diseco-3-hydroxy-5,9,17-trioxoandrosta-1(10),2-diene-4-oate hydrolase